MDWQQSVPACRRSQMRRARSTRLAPQAPRNTVPDLTEPSKTVPPLQMAGRHIHATPLAQSRHVTICRLMVDIAIHCDRVKRSFVFRLFDRTNGESPYN